MWSNKLKNMKTILFLIAFTFCSLTYSQGNLQFNQVLVFTPGSNYTVPSGKVLKVESINFTGSTVCLPLSSTYAGSCCPPGYSCGSATMGNYNAVDYMTIGNLVFNSGASNAYCSIPLPSCAQKTITLPTINLPMWLPAGKSISINSGTASMMISASEFNIGP
jgi:hypothetical protein